MRVPTASRRATGWWKRTRSIGADSDMCCAMPIWVLPIAIRRRPTFWSGSRVLAKHVAVLMGGWSSERPVSLSSGKACADATEAAGYRVTRVDVGRDVGRVLAELEPDVAFNAL